MISDLDYIASEFVPIFPLSNNIFFPHMVLPLHIFENRYKEMVKDLLQEKSLLVITQKNDNSSSKNLSKIACIGKVLEHMEFSDGRYFLLLQGLSRVFIEEEAVSSKPYTLVKVSVLEDQYPEDSTNMNYIYNTIKSLIFNLARQESRLASTLVEVFSFTEDLATLSDILGMVTIKTLPERQRLLESVDVENRLKMITVALAEILQTNNNEKDILN